VAGKRSESSVVRTDVNRHLRMAVKRFDVQDSEDDAWDFLCECGSPDCKEWVTFPLSQYEELRNAGLAVLAPGHELRQEERSRRRARRLVEDAKALRAQAEHQLRRAARNLRHTRDEPR
jgi:hypothetical protein